MHQSTCRDINYHRSINIRATTVKHLMRRQSRRLQIFINISTTTKIYIASYCGLGHRSFPPQLWDTMNLSLASATVPAGEGSLNSHARFQRRSPKHIRDLGAPSTLFTGRTRDTSCRQHVKSDRSTGFVALKQRRQYCWLSNVLRTR